MSRTAAAVSGPLSAPVYRGGFELTNGSIHLRGPPQAITELDLKLGVVPGELIIEQGAFSIGGGRVQLRGNAPLTGFRRGELHAFITARNVALPLASGVHASVDADLRARWQLLGHFAIAAVVLLLERRERFSGTYWTNIVDAGIPFLGIIEHTNLVPAERYPARYLYVSNYVAGDDALTHMSTDELLRHYAPALRRINPSFDERGVLRAWSFREEAAQPVPRLGNRDRIPPFATPVPGLFLANTTQIYPEDRGTNYSARLGREAAEAMAA